MIGLETVALAVTDTGIGINESKFKDIFEAFQQEDGSIDRHYGGTGLGLTIARKFAHLLGGEIHVESKKGEGSTFTLYLPLGSARIRSSHAPQPTASESTPATGLQNVPRSAVKTFIPDDRKSIGPNDKVLLIIEDDREFASTLIKIARKRGYRCLAAGDGKSGLILATEQPVTAIILDLRLPAHGVLTIGAIISLIFGSLLFFNSGGPYDGAKVNPIVVYIMAGMIGLISFALIAIVVRAQRRPITTGIEGMIGAKAVALTPLVPMGHVSYGGETWSAIVDDPTASADEGSEVQVVAIEGLLLHVQPVRHQQPALDVDTLTNTSLE